MRPYLQLIAFIVVVVAAVGTSYIANHNAIERERQAQIVQCERVQVLRDQTNGLALADYEIYIAAHEREAKLIKSDPQAAETHRKSSLKFYEIAHTLSVTAPTNCREAVDRPERYRAPAPVFIYRNGPEVEAIRGRSEDIVRRARRHVPLPPLLRDSG